MKHLLVIALAACGSKPAPSFSCAPDAPALTTVASPHDHATTVAKLSSAIEARGLAIVQRIDHAAAAKSAELELPASTVLVFGNPKVGTPLIQAAPAIALDLPLRVLVVQRATRVELVYRTPAALAATHGAAGHPAVAKITEALAAITAEAARP